MTVLDASVVVNALANDSGPGRAARERLAALTKADAPAVVRAETMAGLRRRVRAGDLSAGRAEWALGGLGRLALTLHGIEPVVARVWDLRENLTIYDAWYVALAEALDTTLVTADARLASAPGVRCPVEVVTG